MGRIVWLSAAIISLGSVCAAERTATGVRQVTDGRVVWNFEIDVPDGKPYIHPLVSPSGVTLTELMPKDHVWHKGLWFSWKYLNGVNYWETPDKCGPGGAGRSRVTASDVTLAENSACVRLSLVYSDKSGEVMTEGRTISITPPDENGGYSVKSHHDFVALKDLTIDRTPPYRRQDGTWAGGYAGLTLRLTARAAETFCLRKDRSDAVEYENPASGESVMFAAFDEPPAAKFYAWPNRRMSNLSVVYKSPLKLTAGEHLRLAYEVRISGSPRSRQKRF